MVPLLARLVVLAAGALVCFRGYSSFRAMLGLTAFLVTAHAAASHPAALPSRPEWLAPTLVLGAGLLAAALVLLAWKIGVPLLGAVALVLVAQAASAGMPLEPTTRLVGLALVGLLGAVLARLLERVVLSIATAAYGAFILVSGIAQQPTGRWWVPAGESSRRFLGEPWALGLWIALAVAGAAVQLRPKRPPAEEV